MDRPRLHACKLQWPYTWCESRCEIEDGDGHSPEAIPPHSMEKLRSAGLSESVLATEHG